jgi:electron transport complex protein RnfB
MSNEERETSNEIARRSFLRAVFRGACLVGIGGIAGLIGRKHVLSRVEGSSGGKTVSSTLLGTCWQIDPYKCIACGNCETFCVLEDSAVKCVHAYAICGYCRICFGFFGPQPLEINEGAENQLCPTGAIKRAFVEDPYYEYTIDESLCIGCGECVKGCNTFGNGSLFLQVRHDRCLNCNECSIAAACPSGAFKRVPANNPYITKRMVRS